jgi:hypothetical protein
MQNLDGATELEFRSREIGTTMKSRELRNTASL